MYNVNNHNTATVQSIHISGLYATQDERYIGSRDSITVTRKSLIIDARTQILTHTYTHTHTHGSSCLSASFIIHHAVKAFGEAEA
jgi:hypothetical protein